MTAERMKEVLAALALSSQLEIINEDRPRPITREEIKIFKIIISDLIIENYGISS